MLLLKCFNQYVSKFGKVTSGHGTGKGQISLQFQRRTMPKNAQNYCRIALISHDCKAMLKTLQSRHQHYMNRELPEVQAGFRNGRRIRDQIANIHQIIEKTIEFQKNIYFCFFDDAKDFNCVDHKKLWKIFKEMEITGHIMYLLRNLYAGQEATSRTGHGNNELVQNWERSMSRVYTVTLLI